MRRLSAFLAILLLLITAAPVMACVTGDAMTQQESACCRAMHGDCGDMAAMGCCQKQIKAGSAAQLATSTPTIHVQWVVAYIASVADAVSFIPRERFRAPVEHSPPGLRIARTTVLRI